MLRMTTERMTIEGVTTEEDGNRRDDNRRAYRNPEMALSEGQSFLFLY